LIAAFSVFCFLFCVLCFCVFVLGALGGFFFGLRAERLPGGGLLSFLAKKKVTKESCLGNGNELNAHRAIASLGPWVLIRQLVAMPEAGWFYRSFANSFKLCLI